MASLKAELVVQHTSTVADVDACQFRDVQAGHGKDCLAVRAERGEKLVIMVDMLECIGGEGRQVMPGVVFTNLLWMTL